MRDKAIIDHLVRRMFDGRDHAGGTHHPATTATGLHVAEQIRKEWQPGMGGLAIF
jgi:hypothetical protein